MRTFFSFTLLPLFLGSAVVFADEADMPISSDTLHQLIESAYNAASTQLVSGEMTGTYRMSQRPSNATEWQTETESQVRMRFDMPRYNIELNYQKEKQGLKRRVIIFDNAAITTSRFSDRITKTGCQAEVFAAAKRHDDAPINPTLAGFPWDMSRTAGAVMNPVKVFESHPTYKQMLSRDDNQDIVLRVRESDYTIEAKFAKRFGFNPTSMVVVNVGSSEPAQQRAAKWKLTNGVWHISSLTMMFAPLKMDGELPSLHELELAEFEINPKIPADAFTLSALDLPGGTRILDHRPETDTDRRILYNPLADSDLSVKLDGVVEQLRELPTPNKRGNLVQRSGWGNLRWLLVANIVGVLLIISLWLWLRR